MKWCIYKHVNKTNGKVYIGQTRKSPNARWRNGKGYGTGTRFSQAIKKYSWNGFLHEIIEDNIDSQKYANEREIYWINYYKSYDFNYGYNMTPGGYSQSSEVRQKATDTFKENSRNKIDFIYCVELAKLFPNTIIAWEWFERNGYCEKRNKNPIIRVVNKENATCFGFHFCSIRNILTFTPRSKELSDSSKGARKKVVCIDTGDVFDSLSECGRQLDIKTQHLSKSCKNHTKTHGKYFCYLDEYNESWKKYEKAREGPNKHAIYCIELDKQWDSYTSCGRELGFSPTLLTRLIQSQNPLEIYHTIDGKHFCKPNEIPIFNIVDKPITRSDSRAICCIETQETYKSITEAERICKCRNILKCCKNWKYTSGGYHWCFLDDLAQYKPVEQIDRANRNGLAKRVIKIEDGTIFSSATAAAKTVNRNVSSLVESIKNGTKCGGAHWNYIDDL